MFDVSNGKPCPLGVNLSDEGVNFAIFSRNASSLRLLIFDDPDSAKPIFIYNYDTSNNKTGDVWHSSIRGINELINDKNLFYAYELDGENTSIDCFNLNKLILDPYAKATYLPKNGLSHESLLNSNKDKSAKYAPKGLIFKSKPYNKTKIKNINLKDQIIYEMHVKGFSKLTDSKNAGTFKAIIDKIPYLKDLGVTLLELMPINIFDSYSNLRSTNLTNYWGYDSINFFSIHYEYSVTKDILKVISEFKEMIDELHKNEIAVILDVVYNHSPEGNQNGPVYSYKGLDNSIYYLLSGKGEYKNFSGCGNTINCNHPVMQDLIIDSLVYFVTCLGVDGFRFDLASIMTRDNNGDIIKNAPIVERISQNPVLRDTIIIAEAWDAAGAYQVGNFGDKRWAEWNGKYRDYVRSFVKSDFASISKFADSVVGSPSLYAGKSPDKSINFVTCHDGFTLYDLVSYNEKHNLDNGEENKDGESNNLSWNCGIEGQTGDNNIIEIRTKQMKNLIATLMVSLGVPMLRAGDEFCHTQNGNNNPYCQDNEISWLDWSKLDTNKDFFRFVKLIINFRKNTQALRRKHYYDSYDHFCLPQYCDISWYGKDGNKPNWEPNLHHFALMIKGWMDNENRSNYYDDDIFIIFNSHWENHKYVLPKIYLRDWFFLCDTSNKTPDDICELADVFKLDNQDSYMVNNRSVVILLARYKAKKKDNLSVL